MGTLRHLFDFHDSSVFWSAVGATVSFVVAVVGFAKWLVARRNAPVVRKPQGLVPSKNNPEDLTPFPPALLAFVASLVFVGIVAGMVTHWDRTFQVAIVAILATTSTFWLSLISALLARRGQRKRRRTPRAE